MTGLMQVEVRLFAVCRERAGKDRVTVSLSDERAHVAGLLEALAEAEPALAAILPSSRVAVNQTFASAEAPLGRDDEVAIIPPVSGGSGIRLAEVRETPIELAEVEEAVRAPRAGALCSFAGTVRDHTGPHGVRALDYEAYSEMAERMLRSISAEVCERWPETRVAVLHRTGHLDIGEVSVAIAVSSPHRAEAFDGCRHVIERLKEDAPIWKKEIRTDGSTWIGSGS